MPESDGKAGCNRLAGRRIIITGAASGIAKAMAGLFHREGAMLALIDRDADGVEAAARELGALPLTLDLAEAEGIAPTVDYAAREMGGLDGVVNCAAIGVPTSIEDTDIPTLARFVAINLTAPFLLCRAALPHLRKADIATIRELERVHGAEWPQRWLEKRGVRVNPEDFTTAGEKKAAA